MRTFGNLLQEWPVSRDLEQSVARRVAKSYASISRTHVHVVDCDLQRAFGFFVAQQKKPSCTTAADRAPSPPLCGTFDSYSFYSMMSASEKGNLSHPLSD